VTDAVLAPLVVLGLGVAASPLAAIAAILLVTSPGGRTKGGAFVAGWAGGLAVLGGLVVALEGAVAVGGADGPGLLVSVGSLALGLVLLGYGLLRWIRRPGPGDDDPSPKWMAAFDPITAGRALATGAVLAAAKPKNLVLTIAAATAIAEGGLSTPAAAGALAVYVLVASATAGAPLVVAVAMGERAGPVLAGWRAWLTAHNAAIMTVVLLAFGAILAWRGATGLA
jgi:hypothetical protein